MSEEDRCPNCKGEKIAEEKKEFEVKLDPGVPENHVYTLQGEGNEVVRRTAKSLARSRCWRCHVRDQAETARKIQTT